jgi:hypothetical protein
MRTLRVLFVILSLSLSLLAGDSPFSGTWKFNPTKGHPDPPLAKSNVAVVDADETNFSLVQKGIDDKDKPFEYSYKAKLDGKDYPISGDPDADSVSLKRVGQREMNITLKKDQKITFTLNVVVSEDGRTTTIRNADDLKKASDVYDKQ